MNILNLLKVENQTEKRAIQNEKMLTAEELFDSLIDDYTTVKREMIKEQKMGNISQSTFMDDVKNHLNSYHQVTAEVEEEALRLFEQYIFGYSRLTPLIEDMDITDIRCVSFDNIRIKKKGVRKQSDVVFRSEKEYKNFIDFVATRNQVNVSNLTAIQRFVDIKSSKDFILRFTIAMPLVNTYDEPYLVIRKVPKNFPEMEDLIKKDMLSKGLADELIKRFRTGSTLICGGNSSGKTTLLNALKETLPEDMAVLVSQQADELTSKWHRDMMFMHSLPESGEMVVSYELDKISEAGLTMDVDFFILGEIKGAEALYVLNAAYTGQFCAATIHSPSADKAPDKLVDYAMYESRYDKNELLEMFCSCFNTVIFMKKYKVHQIYEISGWDSEKQKIKFTPIFEREAEDGVS